jgi:hypothetical protein
MISSFPGKLKASADGNASDSSAARFHHWIPVAMAVGLAKLLDLNDLNNVVLVSCQDIALVARRKPLELESSVIYYTILLDILVQKLQRLRCTSALEQHSSAMSHSKASMTAQSRT